MRYAAKNYELEFLISPDGFYPSFLTPIFVHEKIDIQTTEIIRTYHIQKISPDGKVSDFAEIDIKDLEHDWAVIKPVSSKSLSIGSVAFYAFALSEVQVFEQQGFEAIASTVLSHLSKSKDINGSSIAIGLCNFTDQKDLQYIIAKRLFRDLSKWRKRLARNIILEMPLLDSTRNKILNDIRNTQGADEKIQTLTFKNWNQKSLDFETHNVFFHDNLTGRGVVDGIYLYKGELIKCQTIYNIEEVLNYDFPFTLVMWIYNYQIDYFIKKENLKNEKHRKYIAIYNVKVTQKIKEKDKKKGFSDSLLFEDVINRKKIFNAVLSDVNQKLGETH